MTAIITNYTTISEMPIKIKGPAEGEGPGGLAPPPLFSKLKKNS